MECNDAQMWHGVRFWLWCIAGYFSRDAAFLSSARIPTRVPTPIPSSGTAKSPASSAKRELSLANSMGQLDAGDRDGGVRERLEPSHIDAASLDRAVVLFDDVVQVLARAHFDVAPTRMSRRSSHNARRLGTWPSSVTLRGTRGAFDASALRKNACAAAIPRSRRSRKSTVLPCLSTARYR